MAETTYCIDFKQTTPVVNDRASGDTICLDCGLVLEAYAIDEKSEWRTFSADFTDGAENEPNRVGCVSNPFLDHNHLSTIITQTPKSSKSGFRVPTWENRLGPKNTDKKLIQGFEGIATMAEKLNLLSAIKNRANEIFKNIEDRKIMRVAKKNEEAVYAACLSIACEEEHKPRTFKEFASVANGTTRSEIGQAKQVIEKDCKKEMGVNMEGGGGIHATDIVMRFCYGLSLNFTTIKAAKDILAKLEVLDIRRSPITMAAAVIYLLTQLSQDEKRHLQEVSDATGVAVNTIKNAYKDIYQHASLLIPS